MASSWAISYAAFYLGLEWQCDLFWRVWSYLHGLWKHSSTHLASPDCIPHMTALTLVMWCIRTQAPHSLRPSAFLRTPILSELPFGRGTSDEKRWTFILTQFSLGGTHATFIIMIEMKEFLLSCYCRALNIYMKLVILYIFMLKKYNVIYMTLQMFLE